MRPVRALGRPSPARLGGSLSSRARVIAIGAVGLVVVAGLAAFILSRLFTPSSTAYSLVDETTLVVLQGTVQVTRGGTTTRVDAGADSVVRPGDRIRTSADSYASVTFFDGSTTELEPGTDIILQRLERRPAGGVDISFRQELGLTWNRVERLVDANSRR